MDDLLTVIGRDVELRKVATTKGGEYAGPCPMCGGRDRLRVWPHHPGGRGAQWWCRGCSKGGDAIAYLVELGDLTALGAAWARGKFTPTEWDETMQEKPIQDPVAWLISHGHMTAKAAALVGQAGGAGRPRHLLADSPAASPRPPAPRHPDRLAPPGPTWQERARAFVAYAQQQLWGSEGAEALGYLRGRGLDEEMIWGAALGWNPSDWQDTPERWGLDPWTDDRGRPGHVWLPRGWVIPWDIAGELWRVNIRRPQGDPKYIGPKGSRPGLYNADALAPSKPAILVEGEFDALILAQVAGDLAAPVATGSIDGSRRPRWLAALALCPAVLVAYDADDPGEKAAAYWVGVLSNSRRWRPLWQDANAMHQGGADLRGWVLAGLGQPAPDTDKARKLAECRQLAAEMTEAGVSPDGVGYTSWAAWLADAEAEIAASGVPSG